MSTESRVVGASKDEAIRKRAVQEILNQMELLTQEDLAEVIERATFTGEPNPSLIRYYEPLRKKIEIIKLPPIRVGGGWIIPGIPQPDYLYLKFNEKIFALNIKQTRVIEKDLNIKLQTANQILSDSDELVMK